MNEERGCGNERKLTMLLSAERPRILFDASGGGGGLRSPSARLGVLMVA